jgi:site-specific recombinase XerD
MAQLFDQASFEAYLDCLAPASRLTYERNIELFIDDCEENDLESNESLSLVSYITSLHNEGLKTSTLWSITSMISAYFEFGFHIIIKSAQPSLKRKLELWEKQDEVKKAKVIC